MIVKIQSRFHKMVKEDYLIQLIIELGNHIWYLVFEGKWQNT